MTKEQIKQTAEKELVAYLKGCAFSLCPASQKYMAEHIEEILKASETTKKLQEENEQLKKENAEYEGEARETNMRMHEYVIKTVPQLVKATKIIKDLLLMAKVENLERNYESVDEAKQFLEEVKE